MTENDQAWQRVFEALDLAARLHASGPCYVTADELKTHGRREPRLMAKLDTLADRPEAFRVHGVNIFPVRNGRYVLLQDPDNRTYYRFGELLQQTVPRVYTARGPLPSFDTFPASRQFSESQAIDFAFVTSLLRTFFGQTDVHLTVRGRLFSDPFTFRAPGTGAPIEVNKVQIEVDAGFEGADHIFLLEAKIGKRDDFNIRQLYYPFLNWSARSRKRVVPIFLTYTNGQYYLTQFAFGPAFGELAAVRNECYTINDSPFAEIDWRQLLREVPAQAEEAPFPQADDLDKVVDLVQRAADGVSEKSQFAEFFEMDERQGDYYANAAKYLGWLRREGHQFQLTESGAAFSRLPARAQRTLHLARQLLQRPVFHGALERLAERNFLLAALSEGELAELISQHAGLNPTTARRRACTARNWIAWLLTNSRTVASAPFQLQLP